MSCRGLMIDTCIHARAQMQAHIHKFLPTPAHTHECQHISMHTDISISITKIHICTYTYFYVFFIQRYTHVALSFSLVYRHLTTETCANNHQQRLTHCSLGHSASLSASHAVYGTDALWCRTKGRCRRSLNCGRSRADRKSQGKEKPF